MQFDCQIWRTWFILFFGNVAVGLNLVGNWTLDDKADPIDEDECAVEDKKEKRSRASLGVADRLPLSTIVKIGRAHV